MWQRTLEEFELENQGRPIENLRTVARSPFVFSVFSRFLCPRPPLLLSAPNQNRHATQAIALLSVEWMVSINLFKVVANVGNPPLCSGVIAVPSGPKSNTFTVILAVFAPQPRLHHKGLICLFSFNSALYSTKAGYNTLRCFCNKINWNRGKLKLRKSIIWIYHV